MHYTGLICICLSAFFWRMSEAAPLVSIHSSSNSRTQKMINGKLRTITYNVEDDVKDIGGKMVHNRFANFNSEIMSPSEQKNLQQRLSEVQN
ncbi:accessory gland-specific peptide 26Ab [Drosophila bipectinata]|uniref:accessory gland-specific peptide 26Ab n=1 Tax=Drosophila bipectinata TaxID=42026 RepID=UPI001C8AA766|nr:accessory gland-specific peptide 26Ab [Drosophila bipectinata]